MEWGGGGKRKEKNLELKSGGREGDRRRYKRRRRRRAKDCYTDRTQKRKTFKIYARVKKKIEIKKKVRKTGGGGEKRKLLLRLSSPLFPPDPLLHFLRVKLSKTVLVFLSLFSKIFVSSFDTFHFQRGKYTVCYVKDRSSSCFLPLPSAPRHLGE